MKVVHCLYIKYFYEGCTVFVHGMPRFAPLEILQTLTNYPITTLCAPPTLYRLIQTNSIKSEKQLNYVNLVKLFLFCCLHKVQFMKSGYCGFISRKIAALVIVNLTRCSLQSDHVNLAAPASLAYCTWCTGRGSTNQDRKGRFSSDSNVPELSEIFQHHLKVERPLIPIYFGEKCA